MCSFLNIIRYTLSRNANDPGDIFMTLAKVMEIRRQTTKNKLYN